MGRFRRSSRSCRCSSRLLPQPVAAEAAEEKTEFDVIHQRSRSQERSTSSRSSASSPASVWLTPRTWLKQPVPRFSHRLARKPRPMRNPNSKLPEQLLSLPNNLEIALVKNQKTAEVQRFFLFNTPDFNTGVFAHTYQQFAIRGESKANERIRMRLP